MNILGIVTARGGSKRLPGKNIRSFLGKPLLAWTASVGLESNVLDRFILSTDDEQIAQVGLDCGLEVPFMRPPEYATDTSSSFDPIFHAVTWLKEHDNYDPDWVVLLEPSCPGRQVNHIQDVAQIIQNHDGIDSVVGVSLVDPKYSVYKQLKIDTSHMLTRVIDGAQVKDMKHRNQDVSESYYINSAIYAFKVSSMYSTKTLWGENTYGYEMDSVYALDIDTQRDFDYAELIMKEIIQKK